MNSSQILSDEEDSILDCYEYGQISSDDDSFNSSTISKYNTVLNQHNILTGYNLNQSKHPNIICNRTRRLLTLGVSSFNTKTVSY